MTNTLNSMQHSFTLILDQHLYTISRTLKPYQLTAEHIVGKAACSGRPLTPMRTCSLSPRRTASLTLMNAHVMLCLRYLTAILKDLALVCGYVSAGMGGYECWYVGVYVGV